MERTSLHPFRLTLGAAPIKLVGLGIVKLDVVAEDSFSSNVVSKIANFSS